ncbi:hypothetical protein U9M48_024712 [Paspalum notatum var. saurae]|uniref:Uncharacterized protein n=1 Tax=Paspalum notatum var. saurae TaxID=547442 RepID=A0AAQ3TNP1_PASNO
MAVAANEVRDQRGPMTPIRTEPFIVDRQHIETGGAIPATALRGPSLICNHSWSSTNGPAIYSGLCTILASIEQTSAEAKLMCNVASDEGCCWSRHQCHSGNQQGAPGWRFSGELVEQFLSSSPSEEFWVNLKLSQATLFEPQHLYQKRLMRSVRLKSTHSRGYDSSCR